MARKQKSEHDLVVSAGPAVPSRRKVERRGKFTASPVETPSISEAPEVAAAQVTAAVYGPSREEIARLAYSYWEARGCQGGCPEEDWIRAEQELAAR